MSSTSGGFKINSYWGYKADFNYVKSGLAGAQKTIVLMTLSICGPSSLST